MKVIATKEGVTHCYNNIINGYYFQDKARNYFSIVNKVVKIFCSILSCFFAKKNHYAVFKKCRVSKYNIKLLLKWIGL